jgi:integrase/recombinase XerC
VKGDSLTAQDVGPAVRSLSTTSPVEEGIDHFLAFLGQSGKALRTIEAYRRDLEQFASFLHPRLSGAAPTISRIDSDLVVEFSQRLDRQLSRATAARKMSALSSFFRFLCKGGFLHRNPASDVTSLSRATQNETSPTLESAHIEAALEHAGTTRDFQAFRDRAMLEVLYGAGLRLEELIALNLSALDLDKHLLKVTSGHRERSVPIGAAAREALRAYLLARADQLMNTSIGRIDAGALFVNTEGRRLHRRSVQRIVEVHLSGATGGGVLPIRQQSQGPQALRRAFADHLVKAGAAAAAVSALLGQEKLPALSPSDATFEVLRQRYDRAHPRALEVCEK